MRHLATLSLALLAALPTAPSRSQEAPPHAWLFGTWTGGLFPVASQITPQACFSEPVVIFTRDLVLRATLTEQTLTQREVATARVVPGGFEFRLAPSGATANLFGAAASAAGGFGCASPDQLVVQRRGENEISFPGCADFPYPLVRCQTR